MNGGKESARRIQRDSSDHHGRREISTQKRKDQGLARKEQKEQVTLRGLKEEDKFLGESPLTMREIVD